jgi:hypothetical protein
LSVVKIDDRARLSCPCHRPSAFIEPLGARQTEALFVTSAGRTPGTAMSRVMF